MAGHAQDAHKIVTFVAFAILDFLKVLNYQLCSFFLNGLEKVFSSPLLIKMTIIFHMFLFDYLNTIKVEIVVGFLENAPKTKLASFHHRRNNPSFSPIHMDNSILRGGAMHQMASSSQTNTCCYTLFS